jgi:hypothetical protein
MAQCTSCGAYTKFNGGLCEKCYRENGKSATSVTHDANTDKQSDNSWVYNLIKGRIAETIIQELFLSLGFQVFKYGMENTIPGIMELLKGVKDDVANDIKRMPDLVIYRDRKAHFIEVKFRAHESLTLSDVDKHKDYPYQNALFVVVSKKHIKCISFQELLDGDEISPQCQNYLGSRNEFELDKEKIIEYCKYAVKFFENV